MKPNLYLDVDGVLLLPKNQLNVTLLQMLFNSRSQFRKIFWLSVWTKDGDEQFLIMHHPSLSVLGAKACKWTHEKTEAIDWEKPFIWIEDGVTPEERKEFDLKATPGQYLWEIRLKTAFRTMVSSYGKEEKIYKATTTSDLLPILRRIGRADSL